jgi:hypothetical protein
MFAIPMAATASPNIVVSANGAPDRPPPVSGRVMPVRVGVEAMPATASTGVDVAVATAVLVVVAVAVSASGVPDAGSAVFVLVGVAV